MIALSDVLALGCFAFGISLGHALGYCKVASRLRKLSDFQSRYLRAEGWHSWFGTYAIESFDGGKSWYAMTDYPDGRRLIQGEIEKVYPGLSDEPGVLGVARSEPFIEERSQFGDRLQKNERIGKKTVQEQTAQQFHEQDSLVPRTSRKLLNEQSLCRCWPAISR